MISTETNTITPNGKGKNIKQFPEASELTDSDAFLFHGELEYGHITFSNLFSIIKNKICEIIKTMTGATEESAGTSGLVPTPTAGKHKSFLRGDGIWSMPTKSDIGLDNVPNVSTEDQTPTFTESSIRENIISKETLSTIFGKIQKWFSDLKPVAFSGDYDDLENKPDISGLNIPDLTETESTEDNDYMVIGGEENKKITWANIIKMIIANLTGGVSTILTDNMTANRVMVSDANGKASVSGITTTILNYLSGLTSNVQSQIDTLTTSISGKQSTITGAATTIVSKNLTASRALVADSQGKVAASSTTSTELGYIHGVTSAVQTQFSNLREISVNPIYQASGYWNTGNLNVIRPGIWWINGYGSVTNAPFATHFVMIGQGYNGACLNQVAIDMSTAKIKVRHRDNVSAAWQSWVG